MIFVRELEFFAFDIDGVHFVGGAEADIGAFTGADVADDCLDESPEVSWGTVHDFEDDGGVTIVANAHAFAEIVCGSHWEMRS